MQRCSKCGVEKPLGAFPQRRDRRSGRGTVCLECGRAYHREHYRRNREYYIKKAGRIQGPRREKIRIMLIEYLRSHPCVDCGESDIRVLQFDHRDPSLKGANIGDLVRQGTRWNAVVGEIEKCDVRCGNCHRRKTLLELQSHRGGDQPIREERGTWITSSAG